MLYSEDGSLQHSIKEKGHGQERNTSRKLEAGTEAGTGGRLLTGFLPLLSHLLWATCQVMVPPTSIINQENAPTQTC